MKIIIIGLGITGTLLAETLAQEHHDVMVIDEDQEKIEAITDRINVSGLCGTGISRNTLLEAGADLADVVISLTPSDGTNLLVCAMAKQCGTRFTVARMDNPKLYKEQDYFAEQFSIDYVVTPKYDTAREIARHIGLPGAVRAEGFFSRDVTLIRIVIGAESKLNGMLVRDVRNFMEADMLVVTVLRDGKAFIPKADWTMREGDLICIIAPNHSLSAIMVKLGLIRKAVKNVLIIGGGDVAYSLADDLLREKKAVTILEENRDRCIELSTLLPSARISCAGKIDAEILEEEGIQSADVCVSLTGQDDTNMVYSMFAWSCGVKSVITKIDSPTYEKLLNKVNIDVTISPAVISVNNIVRFIRNQSIPNDGRDDIDCMYKIAGGLAEAVEFSAYDNFRGKDIAFKSEQFKMKKDMIVAAIIRGDTVFVPDGMSQIHSGDKVIVVTGKNSKLSTLNDILA